jgi:hypothetical protein
VAPACRLEVMESNAHRFRLIGVTTAGGASTLAFAVLSLSNCAGLRNITLH